MSTPATRFHERVTDAQIADVFGVAAACPQHIFVMLTKRVERAAAILPTLALRTTATAA